VTLPRVIAVANQKGGVAKTTTVHSLGTALVERGARTLVVDLDPQASASLDQRGAERVDRRGLGDAPLLVRDGEDRKSTRLNSSHRT